jgi:hypothetical protein
MSRAPLKSPQSLQIYSLIDSYLDGHIPAPAFGSIRIIAKAYHLAMTSESVCDLAHDRARPAVVRIVVKSSRVGHPGHPMVRDLMLCATHAQQLRHLGIEVMDHR